MQPAFGPEPLTPLAFIDRSAVVYRIAVVDGDRTYTYDELADRCRRLSGALVAAGIDPGDRVSVLAPTRTSRSKRTSVFPVPVPSSTR